MPPWDLLDKPIAWIDMAVAAMNAEAHASDMHNQDLKKLGR